jgi:hypothetical protein
MNNEEKVMGKLAIVSVGTAATWTIQDYAQLAAIIVAGITALYGLMQIGYLARKWWVQEKRQWKL